MKQPRPRRLLAGTCHVPAPPGAGAGRFAMPCQIKRRIIQAKQVRTHPAPSSLPAWPASGPRGQAAGAGSPTRTRAACASGVWSVVQKRALDRLPACRWAPADAIVRPWAPGRSTSGGSRSARLPAWPAGAGGDRPLRAHWDSPDAVLWLSGLGQCEPQPCMSGLCSRSRRMERPHGKQSTAAQTCRPAARTAGA